MYQPKWLQLDIPNPGSTEIVNNQSKRKTDVIMFIKELNLEKDWKKYKDAAKTTKQTCNKAYNTVRDNLTDNENKNNKCFF